MAKSARMSGMVSANDNPRNIQWKEMVLGDLDVLILQNGSDEGTSTRGPSGSHQPQVVQQRGPPQVTLIDVDLIDDDVAVSSASAFLEAKINSQKKQGRTISDVNLDVPTRYGTNNWNKRQRVPPNVPIINYETYVDLTSSSSMEYGVRPSQTMQPPPPPPPKEPTVRCPICGGPLVEETSTKSMSSSWKRCCISQVAGDMAS
ncbi:hypothetical protein AKJ16_DCAP04698 [Drosera capensis]